MMIFFYITGFAALFQKALWGVTEAEAQLQTHVLEESWYPNMSLNTHMGDFRFHITGSEEENYAFNMGLLYLFNFNQPEAKYWFLNCLPNPMCSWGVSQAYGPFLNKPVLDSSDLSNANKYALQAMKAISSDITLIESSLIKANSIRFDQDQNKSFHMYADQMQALHEQHIGNHLLATLFADSLMVLQTTGDLDFHFYDTHGNPLGRTVEIEEVLKSVIKNSNYPQAHHLYIHLTETSLIRANGTFRSLQSGDLLYQMWEGSDAGHLVHMPGHAYLRTGHWYDMIDSTMWSSKANDAHLKNGRYAYCPNHNRAFAVHGAIMSGKSQIAIQASKDMQDMALKIPDEQDNDGPTFEETWHYILTSYMRFGMWKEILEYDKSFSNIPQFKNWVYPKVIHQYALGFAHLHNHDVQQAKDAMRLLKNYSSQMTSHEEYVKVLANLAEFMLESALEWFQGNTSSAINILEKAVDLEWELPYYEPPRFHMPTTSCLGYLYQLAERNQDAMDTYAKEFTKYYDNPFGIIGMITALSRSGANEGEIKPWLEKFESQTANADVMITTPCVMFDIESKL